MPTVGHSAGARATLLLCKGVRTGAATLQRASPSGAGLRSLWESPAADQASLPPLGIQARDTLS